MRHVLLTAPAPSLYRYTTLAGPSSNAYDYHVCIPCDCIMVVSILNRRLQSTHHIAVAASAPKAEHQQTLSKGHALSMLSLRTSPDGLHQSNAPSAWSIPSHLCQHTSQTWSHTLPSGYSDTNTGYPASIGCAGQLWRSLAHSLHASAWCKPCSSLHPADHQRHTATAHRGPVDGAASTPISTGCKHRSPGNDQPAANCAGQRWGCTTLSWRSWWWPTPSWTLGSASWSCRPWPSPPASLCAGTPAHLPCSAWQPCWEVVLAPTACQFAPA